MNDTATSGLTVYLVGGAVRDQLLGHPWHERDWVVVGATPSDMKTRGFHSVGKDFPVFLHPTTHEEYALARTERKSGRGYTGFTVYAAPDVTLEDDLRRRDLTLNAMARTSQGELIDPYHGANDIASRVLRHVSDAFEEDPLRVLRTARFLARYAHYGFTVAPETEALMCRMAASGELDHLVAERVWKETEKALGERDPGAYFDLLQRVGALPTVMPGLSEDALAVGMCRVKALFDRDDSVDLSRAQAVWALLLSALPADKIDALCRMLKTPNEYRQLACQLAHLAALWSVHRPLSAPQVLKGFDQLDVWRHPERLPALLPLLSLCGVIVDAERIAQLAASARAISPQSLMAQGFKGAALGQAIGNARLTLIQDALGR